MNTILDIEEIETRCEEFFSLYDITREHLRDMCTAKVIHTRNVAKNCRQFAQKEGLSDYECDLAWVIGELHDFARFGQIVVTKGFKDTEQFDHAKFGARILFTHGLIEDIIPKYAELPDEDKKVLEKAVYYHSSYQLPETLTKRERVFCDLIRQADQLDIFRTIAESDWMTIYGCEKEALLATAISVDIAEAFYQKRLADYSKRTTLADYHLAHIALCFGLRTRAAREIAWEQGYLTQMMDITFSSPVVQEKFRELKTLVIKHLSS